MSKENIKERIWQGDQTAIKEVREQALKKKKVGNILEYHSSLLSLYYSFFSKQNIIKKFWWFVLMNYHANELFKKRSLGLTTGQLNVLARFFMRLKLQKKYLTPRRIDGLTAKAVEITAKKSLEPSEKALILATRAEALSLLFPNESTEALELINEAVGLWVLISTSEKTLQAYRQYVRVLRTAGEVYGNFGNTTKQIQHLEKALNLALGEADSVDQAQKIQLVLDKLGRREVED